MVDNELVINRVAEALADALLHEDSKQFVALYCKAVEGTPAAVMAESLASWVFRLIPKSSNQFSLVAPAFPGRNDPCFCGSGQKLKKCCDRIGDVNMLPPAGLFVSALSALDHPQWLEVANKPGWTTAAALIFVEMAMEHRETAAVVMVGRHFTRDISKLRNEHQELVSWLFDALFDEGLDEERLALMQQLTECKRAPSVQAVAWQRQALSASQSGQPEQARLCLQHALRCDSNQRELPMTELTVLSFVAEDNEIRSRARFWQARLRKQLSDDDSMLNFVDAVVDEGKEFFDRRRGDMDWDDPFDPDDDFPDEQTLTHDQRALARVRQLLFLFSPAAPRFDDFMYDFRVSAGGDAALVVKAPYRAAFLKWNKTLDTVIGEGFDDPELLREVYHPCWTAEDDRWIGHLLENHFLLDRFEVIECLQDMAAMLPYPDEDMDAESVHDLSPYGSLRWFLADQNMINIDNVIRTIPEGASLPSRLKANQPFWRSAESYYRHCSENVAGDVSVEVLLPSLLEADAEPDGWLQRAAALMYLKQGNHEALSSFCGSLKRLDLSVLLMNAYALQMQQKPGEALACLQRALKAHEKLVKGLAVALKNDMPKLLWEQDEDLKILPLYYILNIHEDSQAVIDCRNWLIRHLPSR